MGNRRMGLARIEKLLENLKRDINWGDGTTFKGQKRLVEAVTNASAATRTLTAAESGTLFTVNMATVDNNLTFNLPATATSAGVSYDFCFLVNSDDDADERRRKRRERIKKRRERTRRTRRRREVEEGGGG